MTIVLLTGGLGYIGSHIAVELLNSSNNYTVIIVDNLLNSSRDKLHVITQNKTSVNNNSLLFFEIDLLCQDKVEELFKEYTIDIVIHLAGLKAVGESIANPIYYYHNNLVSTIHLIKAMEKYNCKNIIFSSSATVYGNKVAPYHENMNIGIGLTNPYGKTKYMQEEILRDLYKSDKCWNIIILRYFNPISQKNISLKESPNGTPNNIFPFIVKVYNKELSTLQIFGNDYDTPDGTCIRDFIHVVDLANGHIKACEYIINNKDVSLKTYNLGTGVGVSVQELLDEFESVNNTKLNYFYGERRSGDLDISFANCSLAHKELGWNAQYTIKDMVAI